LNKFDVSAGLLSIYNSESNGLEKDLFFSRRHWGICYLFIVNSEISIPDDSKPSFVDFVLGEKRGTISSVNGFHDVFNSPVIEHDYVLWKWNGLGEMIPLLVVKNGFIVHYSNLPVGLENIRKYCARDRFSFTLRTSSRFGVHYGENLANFLSNINLEVLECSKTIKQAQLEGELALFDDFS